MCLNIFLTENSSGRYSLLFDPVCISLLQSCNYVYSGGTDSYSLKKKKQLLFPLGTKNVLKSFTCLLLIFKIFKYYGVSDINHFGLGALL